jgi:hypothetical protein
MSHLSGQSSASTADSFDITDTSTAGGPTVKDSFNTVVTNLALKAPLLSPALTGTPTAPTAAPGTNSTQIATTAFAAAIAALKANIASPTFTGVPAAPTAVPGTNTTQIATTAFAAAIAALKVDAAFTPGTPADWAGSPATIQAAIDRLAACVADLNAAPVP